MSEAPPTVMHKLAYECNWNGLIKRLETHPDEALQFTDDPTWMEQDGECLPEDDLITGTTLAPIHVLVNRRDVPINVVEAYVQNQPKSIQLLTDQLRYPLHLACYSNASLEVIQFLAQADPNTLVPQETWHGWNVFHICTHCGTEENVMSMLLNVAGRHRTTVALGSKDHYGRTPLILGCKHGAQITKTDFALLFQASTKENLERPLLEELSRNYGSYLNGALKLKPPPKTAVSNSVPSPYCNPKRSLSVESFWLWRPTDSLALWRCMHKMLVVLGAANDSLLPTYPLLHECIRQDPHCNTFFFHCILSLNPHYAYQADTNGDLPLHVAARVAENTKEWQNRLATIVVSYPKGASIANTQGKLPLELLHDVSWNHMRLLVRCCPVALSRLNLHESLYANVMAKLGQKGHSSTIFTILKETPALFDC